MVVNLCAFVNGGQHLFFLYECWMIVFFLIYIAVGRGPIHSDFEKRPLFFLATSKLVKTLAFARSQNPNGLDIFGHRGTALPPYPCQLLVCRCIRRPRRSPSRASLRDFSARPVYGHAVASKPKMFADSNSQEVEVAHREAVH